MKEYLYNCLNCGNDITTYEEHTICPHCGGYIVLVEQLTIITTPYYI